MDREIPSLGSEEIELYIRTYFSLLRSSVPVRVKALEETHAGMRSSLHALAESPLPDIGAFTYAYLRLPPIISQTRLVMLGQSEEVFARRGYHDVHLWTPVEAPARRRKLYYNGNGLLAAFVASVSDIDDMVPTLTAFQIEWNKMHHLLNTDKGLVARLQDVAEQGGWTADDSARVQEALQLDDGPWRQLRRLFGAQLPAKLAEIASREQDLQVLLLASSLTDYERATRRWWDTIAEHARRVLLGNRPVYFVSSNTHSILNLLSGYALAHEQDILDFLHEANPEGLADALDAATLDDPDHYNLLYYALRYYLQDPKRAAEHHRWLHESGFLHIDNPLYLDVSAQIFELNRLIPDRFDPRIQMSDLDLLRRSDALIFNVDYPLGMAAYQVLSEVAARFGHIMGVYIMGKAATLNGRVGDAIIPEVVHDEHSRNTFLLRNCFSAQDVAPYMKRGSVLDNQKALTVRGTFLQNRDFMHVFYREGYTDLEMEAGPYLSAVYENNYPKRYPVNEIVKLYNVRYDVGILHYASDTPYSKRQQLLSESLRFRGVEPTYAESIAIIRRIFSREIERQKYHHVATSEAP